MDVPARYKTCKEENCRKAIVKKCYCEPHYSAWHASKNPQPVAAAPVAEKPAAAPAEATA